MATSSSTAEHPDDWFRTELTRVEKSDVRAELPPRTPARGGLMGRLMGRTADRSSQERRLDLEGSPEIGDRVAVIVAHRLLQMQRRDVVQHLPEALFEGALPQDDEDRFMHLADAALTVVRHHLVQTVPSRSEDEIHPLRLRAVIDALDDGSVRTLAERLREHLNARLMERGHDAEIAKHDALLVEIDNVMLGDVDAEGRMAYAMDVIVDGHPLATVASIGDGSIEPLEWLGGHGPEDLEALREYVSLWGEPRQDRHGERPDSLEELLLDRVTVLLTRYAFIEALADAVLFCDTQDDAPGGQVIRVVEIDPEIGRETTWEIVMAEYPDAILLDALGEEDAFVLWLAFSDA
jgi:hypothetical protein